MKFSIRDLLLVTVIVALAIGWWVDRSRLEAVNKSTEDDNRYLIKFAYSGFDPFGGTDDDPFGGTDNRTKEIYLRLYPEKRNMRNVAPTTSAPSSNPLKP